MPRADRTTPDPEYPSYASTPEERQRFRRLYVIALCGHVGLSSRFIADALGLDDGYVRQISRSESHSLLRFPNLVGHV